MLSRVRANLQGEARAVMYIMTRELRQAQSDHITIDQAAGQPYYSRIVFTKEGAVNSITFYQSGNSLIQKVGTNTVTLSKSLSYMSFTFPRSDDMGLISVSMTLQQNIYQGQVKALHMASQQVRIMN